MTQVEQRGISAVLTLNGETDAVKRMFRHWPTNLGTPKDPGDLDLGLVYPYETIVDIFSERDLIVLANAEERMHRYLGSLPLGELVLKPEQSRCERFRRFMAIPILPNPFVDEIRNTLGHIVEQETGRNIADREYRQHVSVSRRRPTTSPKLTAKSSQPSIARNFHVNGYDIGQRVVANGFGLNHRRQVYRNSPQSRRKS